MENAKIQKFKWDILVDFETLWGRCHSSLLRFQLNQAWKQLIKMSIISVSREIT